MQPNAILSCVAFLPLFSDPVPAQGAATLAVMGAGLGALTLRYGLLLFWGGRRAAGRLREGRRLPRSSSSAVGVALTGFGLRRAAD
jgi:threonine/homoserine/homoserine lactone efflux protein